MTDYQLRALTFIHAMATELRESGDRSAANELDRVVVRERIRHEQEELKARQEKQNRKRPLGVIHGGKGEGDTDNV